MIARRRPVRGFSYRRGMGAIDSLQSGDSAAFEKQCEAAGSVASYVGGIPHCVLQAYVQSNDQTRFNPNVPAVPGAVPVSSYRANPSSGGCPIIDPDVKSCAYGADGTIGCNALIECDWFTGMVHKEAPLPGGPTANAVLYANAGARAATPPVPPPAPPSAPQSNSTDQTKVGSGTGQSNAPNAKVVVPPSVSSGSPSFFDSIPWWGWGLALAGGAFFVFGRHH